MLLPQDLFVLLKLIVLGKKPWTYQSLSDDLLISSSQIHTGLKRAADSGLFNPTNRTIVSPALEEFVLHGVRYSFPAKRGTLTRGVPTSFAAPPLDKIIVFTNSTPIPVWEDPEGESRGYSIEPLHSSASKQAGSDTSFYEILALVDAIREGRARERKIAGKEISIRFRNKKK